MVKNIEFICGGNNGRSPIAQAVACYWLKQNGIYVCTEQVTDHALPARGDVGEYVVVSSSGTDVDLYSSIDNKQLAGLMMPYLGVMVDKGLVTREEAEQLEQNAKAILKRLEQREADHRQTILRELGLEGFLVDHHPRQTVVRPDAELILALSQSNLKKAMSIYQDSTTKLRIELLEEIPDPFFESLDRYRQIAEMIASAVVRRMESIYKH